jgi:O-phospho-L-seryl-tRNASec:L-selenocysteinyl-tRNA synthase
VIAKAWRRGRVDAVVQSTDKNFMVPVGGAVVTSGRENTRVVEEVRKAYPGRASIAPVLDLFITLLGMGEDGWRKLLDDRDVVYAYMKRKLAEVAAEEGERLLETPANPISIGFSLESLARGLGEDVDGTKISFFGSMLFSRCVSGTRVVAPGVRQTIGGVTFDGWGASCSAYPAGPYFTAAAAIGTTTEDVDRFCAKLKSAFKDFRKKHSRKRGGGGGAEEEVSEEVAKLNVACTDSAYSHSLNRIISETDVAHQREPRAIFLDHEFALERTRSRAAARSRPRAPRWCLRYSAASASASARRTWTARATPWGASRLES